jgi:hypothetical protein
MRVDAVVDKRAIFISNPIDYPETNPNLPYLTQARLAGMSLLRVLVASLLAE